MVLGRHRAQLDPGLGKQGWQLQAREVERVEPFVLVGLDGRSLHAEQSADALHQCA
ncbi:hypothetical protein D3C83_300250 [compost metagenome]